MHPVQAIVRCDLALLAAPLGLHMLASRQISLLQAGASSPLHASSDALVSAPGLKSACLGWHSMR